MLRCFFLHLSHDLLLRLFSQVRYATSKLFYLRILGNLFISDLLKEARILSQDALQDAELVVIDFFALVPIEHFAQVNLLALIHVVLLLAKYPVHVLVLGLQIIQLCVLSSVNFYFVNFIHFFTVN